ncbi:MAG: NAD-dependent succinate-semialdehyde dehydrogenase [Alphaproteobacteria bacterium]
MNIVETLLNKNLFNQKAFIDGEFTDLDNKEIIEVFNPANNEKIGTVPKLSSDEIKIAIVAAKKAGSFWKEETASTRASLLKKWANLIIDHKDDLAKIMTIEQGKPLKESLKEIELSANYIEWFSEEARRIYGSIIPAPQENQKIFVEYEPIGVVAAITPWNFPSSMIARKAGAALASGCTIVIKPSESTPFSALALAILASEAGIPKGVINIVTGNSKIIGEELSINTDVKKLSFTGSTNVGKLLIKQAASTVKRMSMELGGSAPFIVFADSDIDKTVKDIIACKFRNNGQTCICANRVFIEESVFKQYEEKLIKEVKKLTIGNGLDNVDLGPLISEKPIIRLENLLRRAITSGAELKYGGAKNEGKGSFFEPTILLAKINDDMDILKEEIFGPILVLTKFSREEEVVNIANNSNFGLASYLYTQDNIRIERLTRQLEYGMIGVNEWAISTEVAPFGGIKHSGFGREGSYLGIKEYLNVKYIMQKYL